MDLFTSLRDSGVEAAVEELRSQGTEQRGAVFTKPEVVEFILDLAGYRVSPMLWTKRVLEPSAGAGAFLLLIVNRLMDSYEIGGQTNGDLVAGLRDKIRAVEIHRDSCAELRASLERLLRRRGLGQAEIGALLEHWIVEDDFLLADLDGRFDFVFGNPPYVRQELIPDILLSEYRLRYETIFDRADLYVPFIERSLDLLEPQGRLAFICSDRWMKNRYGLPLRKKVSEGYSLEYHVDMTGADAFGQEVSAYPAITVIARERLAETKLADRPASGAFTLRRLLRSMGSKDPGGNGVRAVPNVAVTESPWMLTRFDQLAVVRDLESRFPVIEKAGCKIGIGVATGADRVFIQRYDDLPVEPSRKEPLLFASDIREGVIRWSGHGVVNPFGADGKLVDLRDYPRLREFFLSHEDSIRKRNVARRNPNNWYRTIDRIYPELTGRPKLLIPDIKGELHPVLDEGEYYPHHNLYYILSAEWPLPFLQVVLRSTVALLFIEMYSVRMRGGYLRFQAQYLRRIRLPRWADVPENAKEALGNIDPVSAPIQDVDAVACAVYGLSQTVIAGFRPAGKSEDGDHQAGEL